MHKICVNAEVVFRFQCLAATGSNSVSSLIHVLHICLHNPKKRNLLFPSPRRFHQNRASIDRGNHLFKAHRGQHMISVWELLKNWIEWVVCSLYLCCSCCDLLWRGLLGPHTCFNSLWFIRPLLGLAVCRDLYTTPPTSAEADNKTNTYK